MSVTFNGATGSGQAQTTTQTFQPQAVDFSMSAWIYPTSGGGLSGNGPGWIINIGAFGGNTTGLFVTRSATGGGLALNGANNFKTTPSVAVSADSVIPFNQWSYVTYTTTIATFVSRLYVNGTEVTYKTRTTGSGGIGNAGTLAVGNTGAIGTTTGFTGSIDMVSIFSGLALSTAQIKQAMFNSSISGISPTTIQAIWPMNTGGNIQPNTAGIAAARALTDSRGTSIPNSTFISPGLTKPTPSAGFAGVYPNSIAASFSNPSGLDLMQVVNQSGQVVWNLNSAGVFTFNPTNATVATLIGKYAGASPIIAFASMGNYDVLQFVNPGGKVNFKVDNQGFASSVS